jgi:hypothetical protein
MLLLQTLIGIYIYLVQDTNVITVRDPLEQHLCRQDKIPFGNRSKKGQKPPIMGNISFLIFLQLIVHFIQLGIYTNGYYMHFTGSFFAPFKKFKQTPWRTFWVLLVIQVPVVAYSLIYATRRGTCQPYISLWVALDCILTVVSNLNMIPDHKLCNKLLMDEAIFEI